MNGWMGGDDLFNLHARNPLACDLDDIIGTPRHMKGAAGLDHAFVKYAVSAPTDCWPDHTVAFTSLPENREKTPQIIWQYNPHRAVCELTTRPNQRKGCLRGQCGYRIRLRYRAPARPRAMPATWLSGGMALVHAWENLAVCSL